jgi:hypothetical protein
MVVVEIDQGKHIGLRVRTISGPDVELTIRANSDGIHVWCEDDKLRTKKATGIRREGVVQIVRRWES